MRSSETIKRTILCIFLKALKLKTGRLNPFHPYARAEVSMQHPCRIIPLLKTNEYP